MAENKETRNAGRQVPGAKQGAAGKAGGGQGQQRAEGGSSSGRYTGAAGSPHEGFAPSSPESNVFPAGASQSGHGSASDHEVAGGTAGAIEASRNRQADRPADHPDDDGGSGDSGMGNRGSR